jgi:hypothetical protein
MSKESPQTITAREAISKIAGFIEKQGGIKRRKDGLCRLTPVLIGVLDAFGVGEASVEKTIFTVLKPNNLTEPPVANPTEKIKNPQDAMVFDSLNKLPEEVKKWLMPDGLLRYGEQGETLLKLLIITSDKKPITKGLLFNIIYRRDIDSNNYHNDSFRLNTLIDSKRKEIKEKGFVVMSKITVIRNNEKKLKELVYWLSGVDVYRCPKDMTSKISQTLVLLRAASEGKPLSYRFLAKEIFGEVTPTSIEKIRNVFMNLKDILEKSGEVLERVGLDKEPEKPWGPKQLGFYIAKKENQVVGESSLVKNDAVLKASQIDPHIEAKAPVPARTIFVKPDPPKENPTNNSYQLSRLVIGDLWRVLRAPLSERVLKNDFGIKSLPERKQQIYSNSAIHGAYNENAKTFESSTDIIGVFKTLRDSLRDLVGEHREEFKKQNPKVVGLVLSILDTVTSSEELDRLMIALCNEYLKDEDRQLITSL